MTSKWFLLCNQLCVSEEVALLSNIISRNFAKIMLCLRYMTNLAKIFKGSLLSNQFHKWKSVISWRIMNNLKWRDLCDHTLRFVEISNKTNWFFNSGSWFIAISWNVTIKRRVPKQFCLFAIALLQNLCHKWFMRLFKMSLTSIYKGK